jgi:transglycosylase-like protein
VRKLLLSALVVGAFTPAAAAALAADNVPNKTNPMAPASRGLQPRAYKARLHTGAGKQRHHRRARKSAAVPAALQSIAACESGGNPQAIGGGGAFRGKYQFDYGTWASVGGHGDPAAAPEAEQDRRAAMLYARQGTTPWPVCG